MPPEKYREAISNLEQNRCVGTSLKSYAADMTVLTYHSGMVLAAMNAYGLYERAADEECQVPEAVKAYFCELCAVMKQTLLSRCRGVAYDMGCGRLMELRQRIVSEAAGFENDEETLEEYAALLELLNPVYAAFLVNALAGKAEKDIQPCKELLALVADAAEAGAADNIEETAIPYLIAMEGLQERYYQPLYRYQLAFADIRDGFTEEIAKRSLNPVFLILDKTSKLLSSSPFAEL